MKPSGAFSASRSSAASVSPGSSATLTLADGGGGADGRQDGYYDEAGAHVAAAQLVAQYVADPADRERVEQERRMRGVTFREVSQSYMR